jgi:tRNA pseudouridine55 synthase
MFSALKHQGRPLYEYARSGQMIERASRQVMIHELTLLRASGDELELRVQVSKGTYIRTLAEAIGERLGCGAHLKALRRTRVGSFSLAQAVRLDEFEALAASDRLGQLQRPDLLLDGLPRLDLDGADTAAISQGRAVQVSSTQPPGIEGLVRLYDPAGRFLGLGAILIESGEVIPKRLLSSVRGQA